MTLKSKLWWLYTGLVTIYGALVFLVPPPPTMLEHYHVSVLKLHLINVTVVVPYALIWLAGFYGFFKLKTYSSHIKKSNDGKQVNRLANGIFLLVLWPPLSSILATGAAALAAKYPGTKTAGILINEYFNLLWPLAGFIVIGIGARGLSELAKLRPSFRGTNILAVLLISLGVLYGYLASYSFTKLPETYHLPYWLVLASLVVPYIYMWFIGMLSTYEIHLYQRKVAGVVYRKSWRLLSYGIGAIVIMQIIVQYITTLQSEMAKLSLNWYILVVYIVLILLAIGYLLLARGAKNLQKIEEV